MDATRQVFTKDDLAFDKDIYEKSLKLFHIAEKYLGLKLHVHATDEALENGQIFVFNHFVRFETVVPVYIFYQRLHQFTRTIADHELFEVNASLSRFLRGAGAVPNNMPGLLAFLAGELLKGHKVVIFPEGRMVKSKQVMNDKGQFFLFGPNQQPPRKHHTGAAVLALTLDLFKWRIRDLFDSGDITRLDRWCQALEFADHESLRKSVDKPTLIVPGTIIFSPLRVGSNFLSRVAQLVVPDMPESLLEEAIIEGNILLKDTDMDIRFGEAIQARQKWTWFDNKLLRRYFLSIKSLEEFFSLGQRSESWLERLMAWLLYRETNRIRDEYIKGLYKGITVNTTHIASVLVFAYLERQRQEIPRQKFHRALYLAVKALQNEPDIHLHKSLNKPDNYRFLYLGKSEHFEQFLKTATDLGLIEINGDNYRLSEKLLDEYHFHKVRLLNPLYVSANEVTPVQVIKTTVTRAIEDAQTMPAREFVGRLWDDELRAFAWNSEKYGDPQYQDINRLETPCEGREPFLLTHPGEPRPSVLLIHGFLSSPAELHTYGEHLRNKGYNVLGVRLSGHGTSPHDLNTRSWEDWLASVKRGFEILSAFASQVIIIGYSTGGSLALHFASEQPAKLKALVTVCSPMRVQDRGIHFAQAVTTLTPLARFVPKLASAMTFRPSYTAYSDTNYRSIPVRSLVQLKELIVASRARLKDVAVPVLVVHSRHDTVIRPDSATIIMQGLGTRDKKLAWVETDNHHIIRENIHDTWGLLDDFLVQHAGKDDVNAEKADKIEAEKT